MFGHKGDSPAERHDEHVHGRERVVGLGARGGISLAAILTGTVVAFGAMFLILAIVGGILAAVGVEEGSIGTDEAVQGGIVAGIALVIGQFFAYLWGGYTAGRMGRGAGIRNGLLVPLAALIVAAVVGAVVWALGASVNMPVPFQVTRVPVDLNADVDNGSLVDWGVAIGIASLAAMFVGAAIGGGMGSRWHTKLERQTFDRDERERAVDLDERPERGDRHDTTVR